MCNSVSGICISLQWCTSHRGGFRKQILSNWWSQLPVFCSSSLAYFFVDGDDADVTLVVPNISVHVFLAKVAPAVPNIFVQAFLLSASPYNGPPHTMACSARESYRTGGHSYLPSASLHGNIFSAH